MLRRLLVVLLVSCLAASSQFDRYKIYDIKPNSVSDADYLHQISVQNGYDGLHISRVLDKPAKIMVAPERQKEFERLLNERGMKFEITVDNVSKHFGQNNRSKQAPLPRSGRISFDRYYRHDAINSYLQEVAAKYPKYAKVETVGKSYEGREMKTIRISNGDGNLNKKVIFVDAGIHAREWVAPAAALYIIDQLLENMDENKNLLTNFDWLILPSVNPDGYDYTSTHTRMWRKTRSKGLLCYGADANRNFGFHWGVVGASNSGCDDTYRGRSAFSEIESQVVRDIMLSLKGRGKFYLTLHSYGNYILYPWGWTSDLPDTWRDLDEVAAAGASAIQAATGGKYTYGSSTNALYPAAGGSDDYAFAEADFPISFTMELPGGGSAGFDLPESQINAAVSEAWIGIKAMALKVNDKYA